MMTSTVSAANPSTALRLRRDLVHRRIWSNHQDMWVIKDPLSRSYFHFTDQEHAMMILADGTRSFKSLCDDAAALFVPLHLPPERVVYFFADAHSKGLMGSGPSTGLPTKRSRGINPLAIRLPGIDPTDWLAKLDPLSKIWSSAAAFLCLSILVVTACLIVVSRWSVFAADVAHAAARFDNWMLLLVVIAITKGLHELAHAIVCRKFGARCSEMGIMLLVGIPCLYCDVSDAWMLDRPWKRMLVSGAGMIAEMTLAAIATFIWVMTLDGPLRDACVSVMVVCSVSTVVFNGNPLMKYDGYYILSDSIGMPNLYSRARTVLRHHIIGLMGGSLPSLPVGDDSSRTKSFGLILYALASVGYRSLVYAGLAILFYRWSDAHGSGDLALAGMALVGSIVVARELWRWVSRARSVSRVRRRALDRHARYRRVLTGGCILGAIGIVLGMPLPRQVVAPAILQPRSSETIVVTSPGRIENTVLAGATVMPEQVIVELINDRAVDDRLALATRHEKLLSKLAGLRNQRGTSSDASDAIPVTRQAIEEVEKQIVLLDAQRNYQLVRSSLGGVIFAAEKRPDLRSDDRNANDQLSTDQRSQDWSGTVLDPINRGARLDEGTHICTIGNSIERDAVVYLHQRDVELVRINQRVVLRIADRPRGSVTGNIVEIATSPVDQVPKSLIATHRIPSSINDSPLLTYYPAHVRIAHQPITLPVRMVTDVDIAVQPASLWSRLIRWKSDAF